MNESAWPIPVRGPAIPPLDPDLIERFRVVSAATASAKLHQLGVRYSAIRGPTARRPGQQIVGRAVTLQFMPQRPDVAPEPPPGEDQEVGESVSALWAVLDEIVPNDVLVVQAYGSEYTGCLGEMLVTHLKNRGGAGLVVDGMIRDAAAVDRTGLPVWCVGVTPQYASQGELFPWAYHVPISAGGVLVLPGDIVIADDDDGAVIVPLRYAEELLEESTRHEAWEDFSRMMLERGGTLRRYYPLDAVGEREYARWVELGKPEEFMPEASAPGA